MMQTFDDNEIVEVGGFGLDSLMTWHSLTNNIQVAISPGETRLARVAGEPVTHDVPEVSDDAMRPCPTTKVDFYLVELLDQNIRGRVGTHWLRRIGMTDDLRN